MPDLKKNHSKKRYKPFKIALLAALSFLVLIIPVQLVVRIDGNPMIMAARFSPVAGWIEISIISLYCFFLTIWLQKNQAKARFFLWTIFSVTFFTQLILGLAVNKMFLMSGQLHPPVPGFILGNAIAKSEVGFMIVLLISTMVISGPAWCSSLCYFGIWDNHFASNKMPKTKQIILKYKIAIFVLFVLIFSCLRISGASYEMSVYAGLSWGIAGIIIIAIISRNKGSMKHCLYWCPVGLIINLFSRLYPIRIRISDSCDECMKCSNRCRYEALGKTNIKNKKPAITCTNCGDCLSICKKQSLEYTAFGFSGEKVRQIWIIIIATIHCVFLTLARI